MPFRRIRRRHTVTAGISPCAGASMNNTNSLVSRCRSSDLSSSPNPCEHLQNGQKAEEVRAMRAMTACVIRCCLQLLTYILQLISTVLAVAVLSSDKSEDDAAGEQKVDQCDSVEEHHPQQHPDIREETFDKLERVVVTADIVRTFNTYNSSCTANKIAEEEEEGEEEEKGEEDELMSVLMRKAALRQHLRPGPIPETRDLLT